jgi:hypothetical protein
MPALEHEAMAELAAHLPGLPYEPELHRRGARVVAACRWVLAASTPAGDLAAVDRTARWAIKTPSTFFTRCLRDAAGLPPSRDRDLATSVLQGCLADPSAWQAGTTIAATFFDCVGGNVVVSKRRLAWD